MRSDDPALAGKNFSQKVVELALSNIPGYAGRGAFGTGPVIAYWPALIDSKHLTERVVIDGESIDVAPTQQLGLEEIFYQKTPVDLGEVPAGETQAIPLGRFFGTRSGDKGGCANVGVWARTDAARAFLFDFLTVEKLQELMPETAAYRVERFELPNLRALNFYIHDILGEGVSSNDRVDGQAKSMGEYLRSQVIEAPIALIKELS